MAIIPFQEVKPKPKQRRRDALVYFWWSEATGRRVGDFFPSISAAKKWLEARYWRYSKYPVMEQFLETVDPSNKIKESRWWKAARDNYIDLSLQRASVYYIGSKFEKGKSDE